MESLQIWYMILTFFMSFWFTLLLFGIIGSFVWSNRATLIAGTAMLLIGMTMFFLPVQISGGDEFLQETAINTLLHGIIALIVGITLRNIAYMITHKGKIRPFNSNK